MSKAEDRYLEHFQDGRLRNCSNKEAFLLGYQQADKDLKLTWKDIALINNIVTEMLKESGDNILYDTEEDFCKEVLKRFKEQKKYET